MNNSNQILNKSQIIDDKYSVSFFLKKGSYAESYRVQNESKETKYLKLFDYSKLHRTQFADNGNILEIEILKQIKHPNIVKYNDNGNAIVNNQKLAYVVLDFVSGETLAEKMKREDTLNPYEAKDIILSTLNGLNYLHNKQIVHNDITIQNIMLDLSGKVPISKIIDFGYARFLQQSNKEFLKDGLNPFYTANETFNKVFSFQSDIYSVGALYYHLLTGLPPYFVEISKYKSDKIALEEAVLEERRKPLKFSEKINEQTQNIILKALHPKTEHRFKSTKEFIQALNGELEVERSMLDDKATRIQPKEKKKGKGFSAIAGMQDLKDQLQLDVIDALHNPEEYAKYGVTIPNGMLLYGPPGCGKTFFAKHFAEEVGFNFMLVKSGTLKSRFVNATEENISKMFHDAEENAPTIIFIDEISGLFPSRDSEAHEMSKNAVEAMLTEMDRTGERGIFVLCATNYPDRIDAALLRSGRLDKKYYLSPPDYEARRAMFEMYLQNRHLDFGIDYDKIASATKNYVSSDIKLIVDEASRIALKTKSRISMRIIEDVINKTKPSVSSCEIEKYQIMHAKLSGEYKERNNERPRIGFK
ncbi:transitional endoplasmic reticulum ATPase [Parabacteroides sp. PFB2-10]|uniref:protein kinase domain-containing protein n=1 Tax=Parabacteroides sp. PFB2-10 TaxID=1742405 RepID=UPI0024738C42|nr:AAA family ATPase [Parabacteroides sp. PFB2-10]MDH6311608.1 transitional endoplasmic reticulum ATPase [Parabacteroides sp. PFB2-10]